MSCCRRYHALSFAVQIPSASTGSVRSMAALLSAGARGSSRVISRHCLSISAGVNLSNMAMSGCEMYTHMGIGTTAHEAARFGSHYGTGVALAARPPGETLGLAGYMGLLSSGLRYRSDLAGTLRSSSRILSGSV